MIDIHYHLIYGVDDGSPDLETSLAMARISAAEGVKHIVCTPHASDVFKYNPELVEERFAEIRDKLKDEVELSLGCELHLTAENIFDAKEHPLRFSVSGNGYLLVEFDNISIPPQMTEALAMLQSAGYRLIIAHPERYLALQNQQKRLSEWVRMGCLLQVTAGSLYGRFGRRAEALSNELLNRNWIHFIASDAHGLHWRSPHMKRGFEYVANRAGAETAKRLFVTNPRAVVGGTSLPEQPEPAGMNRNAPFRLGPTHPHAGNRDRDSRHRSKSGIAVLWNRLFHS
jgi:protein-tyrosine phosphatase